MSRPTEVVMGQSKSHWHTKRSGVGGWGKGARDKCPHCSPGVKTRIVRDGFKLLVDAAINYKGRSHLIQFKHYRMGACGFGRGTQRLRGPVNRLTASLPTIPITCLRCLTIHLLLMHRKGLLCEKGKLG